MNIHPKIIKVTIGIPTYEAGESLVITMNSIYKQTSINDVREIILVIDGHKLPLEIAKRIRHPKLRVIEFSKRLGQSERINNICKEASGDLLVLTNDDIILDVNAVKNLIFIYRKTNADLIAGWVQPIKPISFFRKIIYTGWEINSKVANSWNKENNYLSCNGRLVALSKAFRIKIKIPQAVWNNDAFMYLYTQVNGFRFARALKAIVYYQLPNTYKDHIRQSRKFQKSYFENISCFGEDIKVFYAVPLALLLSFMIQVFLENPIYTMLYLIVSMNIRLSEVIYRQEKNRGYWVTDISTKELGVVRI